MIYFRSSRILLVFVLSLIAVFSIAAPVSACTQAPTPPTYNLEDHIRNAQFVLIGTVASGLFEEGVIVRADIEVERYLKGEAPASLSLAGFYNIPSCYTVIELEQRRIFFASGDAGNILQAVYSGPFDAVRGASEENIAAIVAITHQSTVPDSAQVISVLPVITATSSPAAIATITPGGDSNRASVESISSEAATLAPLLTITPSGLLEVGSTESQESMSSETQIPFSPTPDLPESETVGGQDVSILLMLAVGMVVFSTAGLITLFLLARRR